MTSTRRIAAIAVAMALVAVLGAGLAVPDTRTADAVGYEVNSADDIDNGPCDATHCSLREAIIAAQQPGDTISFNIPGSGPHIINVGSEDQTKLPAVAPSVSINGYTQPGASPNSASSFQPGNAVLQIVIDGSQVTEPNAQGLWIGGTNVQIRGLVIQNFSGDAIHVGTVASATIRGNYIGVDATGTVAQPNAGAGVHLVSNEPGNVIGGTAPADRNLISGNVNDGVQMDGVAKLAVYGNFIGTDVSGTSAVPNGGGVAIHTGPESEVGAPATGGGNLISGNDGNGITISGASNNKVLVRANRIGTTANGQAPLPNQGHGMFLSQGAFGNTLGAVAPANWNTIAYNTGAGIAFSASAGVDNYIDPNIIHSNGGLGIDLNDDGVTPNDDNDADVGPNDLQNFPIITRAEVVGSLLEIEGTLNTEPGGFYPLFFFASEVCDPSGYGEGQRFVGEDFPSAVQGQPGDYTFEASFNVPVFEGEVITATASNPESTSEFSECFAVEDAPPSPTPSPTLEPTPTPGPSPSPTASPTPTVTGTASPTPTDSASPSVTATPTASPGGIGVAWADLDCSGESDPVDALKALRADAGLSVTQPPDCPEIGSEVEADGEPRTWGDVDCNLALNPVDALKVLRFNAALPVSQAAGCPGMDEIVTIA